jgi:Zn-dependent M16 (insulinase) family peptidase
MTNGSENKMNPQTSCQVQMLHHESPYQAHVLDSALIDTDSDDKMFDILGRVASNMSFWLLTDGSMAHSVSAAAKVSPKKFMTNEAYGLSTRAGNRRVTGS